MTKVLKKLKNKRGESLVEVVVSLAILGILSAAFATILINVANFNLKAVRLYKEDTQMNAKFDGDNYANLSITPIQAGSNPSYPKPIIKFKDRAGASVILKDSAGLPIDVEVKGKYETATGKVGQAAILKRFVPEK